MIRYRRELLLIVSLATGACTTRLVPGEYDAPAPAAHISHTGLAVIALSTGGDTIPPLAGRLWSCDSASVKDSVPFRSSGMWLAADSLKPGRYCFSVTATAPWFDNGLHIVDITPGRLLGRKLVLARVRVTTVLPLVY